MAAFVSRGKLSPCLELALVLVRLDHGACFIVNNYHSIMRAAIMHRVADRVACSTHSAIHEPAERKRVRNQIDAAMIFMQELTKSAKPVGI